MNKISSILAILTIGAPLVIGKCGYAAERMEPSNNAPIVAPAQGSVTVNPTPSSILAPQGLSDQEQAQLEQQYRFQTRGKSALLNPYLSTTGGGGAGQSSTGEQTEDEKLYRYFGAAIGLYQKGRVDEAIEIMKYISEKRPDDGYVKSYLDKLISEKESKKKKWLATSAADANLLKNKKIDSLLKDAIDYYKQKRFDYALLKFSDILALDPNNVQAKKYFAQLKEYYLKEVHVEDMVESYENGSPPPPVSDSTEKLLNNKESSIDNAVEKALGEQESKMDAATEKMLNKKDRNGFPKVAQLLDKKESELKEAAKRMLDENEFDAMIKQKRLDTFLNETELGLTVEDILNKKREEEQKKDEYTLGPGDTIHISVRDHPELSGAALLTGGGEVVLPLINEVVKLNGMTTDEATEKIKEIMKRYVKDPNVTVSIDDYKSKNFYVIDEFGCTPFPITRANITLRDALFIADWGDNRALGRVIVMKPDKLHPVIRKVDTFDMIYRGNLKNNIRIEDGDVIYAPLSIAAKVSKTIADTLRPFAAVRQARDEWTDLRWNSQQGWEQLGRIPRNSALQTQYTDPNSSIANTTNLVLTPLTLGH